MTLLVRGKILAESRNPVTRVLIYLYSPLVKVVLRIPRITLILALGLIVATAFPLLQLGTEFMPPFYEGNFLFMPTAPDGLGTQEAARIIRAQDAELRKIPEFVSVFGKAGAAETATDPAPISMFETIIQVKVPEHWRPGVTWEGLQQEIQNRVQTPGMANILWMPIQTRLEMLNTGFRSNLGLRVYGPNLHAISDTAEQIEHALKDLPGTRSVFADRSEGGRYLDIIPNREALARYNLRVEDVDQIVETAIGGGTIDYALEGRQRYPISVRLQRDFRGSLEAIEQIPVAISGGAQVPLSDLAKVSFASGPPAIRSEGGQMVAYVSIDTDTPDFTSYVKRCSERLTAMVHPEEGVYWEWAGYFQQLHEVEMRLLYIIPFTLLIITLLVYLNTGSMVRTALVMMAVPFSLVGAFWLLYFLGYKLSVAVAVGLIALAGIDAETGVVMLLYLDEAYDERVSTGRMLQLSDLVASIYEGAVQRVRPKIMTVAAILFGLLPILWSSGTGSEMMKRIAAPMVGGVITSALLELLLYPALYLIYRTATRPNWRLPAEAQSGRKEFQE